MPRRVSLPGAAELFRTTPAERRSGRRDDERVDERVADAEPERAPVEADRSGQPANSVQVGNPGQAEGRQDAGGRQQPEPRPTAAESPPDESPSDESPSESGPATSPARSPITPEQRTGRRSGSGRVRHDEKITVYVSNDELLDLERARLSLRAEHRMAVDRGRIVRAALAMALGDLAERGPESELVRRLSQP
ncbi:hypothetical protein [Microlunatus soli]|uniref:Cobyrinic acid a,c-diamide synthase n=1 Tax=Microlunatus soli TaxID=630515 RepID=A0A1H1Y131_9ACTN|nr:hypothetical protein SAMN04489812_4324 [Microlunatus soli]